MSAARARYTAQPQSAKIVSHRPNGVRAELTSEETGDQWAEITVTEAIRHVSEAAYGLVQS
jgi:hypothetical protein